MKYDCIFCGKKVERDVLKSTGFCDECDLAQKHAKAISDKIKSDQGIITINGKDFKVPKEVEEKILEAWINDIIYGDKCQK